MQFPEAKQTLIKMWLDEMQLFFEKVVQASSQSSIKTVVDADNKYMGICLI